MAVAGRVMLREEFPSWNRGDYTYPSQPSPQGSIFEVRSTLINILPRFNLSGVRVGVQRTQIITCARESVGKKKNVIPEL